MSMVFIYTPEHVFGLLILIGLFLSFLYIVARVFFCTARRKLKSLFTKAQKEGE